MDMEQFGLPILRKEDIKEIDSYENDEFHKNIFYATLRSKEKVYLLELSNSRLLYECKDTVSDIIRNKHKCMLKPMYLMTRGFDTTYICYEFTDILLSKYIVKALPGLDIRLSLLRQCVEILHYFKKMNLAIDIFDSNYIFIEGLDNPIIRVLYHGKFKY
jgi:hypothetical protein